MRGCSNQVTIGIEPIRLILSYKYPASQWGTDLDLRLMCQEAGQGKSAHLRLFLHKRRNLLPIITITYYRIEVSTRVHPPNKFTTRKPYNIAKKIPLA